MPPISTPATAAEEPPIATTADETISAATAFHIINEETNHLDNTTDSIELKPQPPPLSTINLPSRDQTTTGVISDKPNVIVYPTRRVTTTATESNGNLAEQRQKNFTRSNGYIYTQTKNNNNLKNKFSSLSYNGLNNVQPTSEKLKKKAGSSPTVDNDFTRNLDEKLRKLNNRSKQSCNEERKPFVTVVKKGTFLRPPPYLAQKLLLEPEPEDAGRNEKVHIAKKLYAYASRPKVLNRSTSNSGKPGASKVSRGAASLVQNSARITSNVTGLTRVRREANGDWKVYHNDDAGYGNMMFDKRIHRGNTYALQPLPCPGIGDEATLAARAAESRRRAMCRQKVKDKQAYALRLRLGSPPPVKGRKHEPVQTELYLEELFEHPDMFEKTTQTDLFLDRPKSPFYYPAKVGLDVATQIYPGDLFDFDIEVQPILEVLVGKTIEQALIEVLEEEEIEALREQQRRFEEIRNADCAEAQRLEERERRYAQEKDRRVAEHTAGAKAQKETEERIAAAVLMQGYIADLLPSVLEGLKEDGFLLNNMKAEVDETFMPWLMKEVTTEMENMVSSRDLLSDIVKEILETRHEIYRALGEADEPQEDLLVWSEEGDTDDHVCSDDIDSKAGSGEDDPE